MTQSDDAIIVKMKLDINEVYPTAPAILTLKSGIIRFDIKLSLVDMAKLWQGRDVEVDAELGTVPTLLTRGRRIVQLNRDTLKMPSRDEDGVGQSAKDRKGD